jgi:perosamine synthetase
MEFIKVAEPLVGEEECAAVREVLLSGNYVSGKKVQEFEARYAEYIGTKYAVMVNSGTAAIHIILAALGIGPGDEVIVPAMTFFSTATAVIHQNAIPIFADVDEHYCMDPTSMEQVITGRTKAIIPVHYFGYMANMTPLMEIARKYNLIVIEDCAQAHGAEYYGKKAGSIGDAGAFSFFATKNMTTGEGGGITTNDEELAKKAKLIRAHGMINRDDHVLLGYNYRMTEMEAAMGLVQLAKLEDFNAARIRNSEYLLNSLRDLDWLFIENFDPNIKHAYFWCPIRVLEEKMGKPASDFANYLKDNGIGFRQRYQEPLNRQIMLLEKQAYPKRCPFSCPFYGKEIDYAKVHLPHAARFSGKIFGLPNHPKLEPRHLDRVVEVVRAYR